MHPHPLAPEEGLRPAEAAFHLGGGEEVDLPGAGVEVGRIEGNGLLGNQGQEKGPLLGQGQGLLGGLPLDEEATSSSKGLPGSTRNTPYSRAQALQRAKTFSRSLGWRERRCALWYGTTGRQSWPPRRLASPEKAERAFRDMSLASPPRWGRTQYQ